MTKEQLKKSIKKKFGTLSNFCRCSGMDRTKLQILLARDTRPSQEELEAVAGLCKDTQAKDTIGIDWDKMALVFQRIDEYGGIVKFCKDHEQFPINALYVLKNKKYKRHSRLVQALYDHFQIQ